jgi:hypothetical protein
MVNLGKAFAVAQFGKGKGIATMSENATMQRCTAG